VAIVGAGITGLAAAYRLVESIRNLRRGLGVAISVTTKLAGGGIRSEHRDGFILDHGPDSFLSNKPAALALSDRLGITPHVIGTREEFRRTYVAFDGHLHPLPDGFLLMAPTRLAPLATSSLFSLSGKLRMALDLFLPTRQKPDESLASFVGRRLGREALERVAQPLVGGIYTADPSTLSLAATLPRFLEMEREHGSIIRALRAEGRASAATEKASGARWSLFSSFDQGMETLVESLRQHLPGDSLRFDRRVESVVEIGRHWQIDGAGNYDAIVLAVPAPAAGRILRGVDAALAADLEGIHYASSVVVNMAYPREAIPNPLDGFGFVVPHVEGRNIIACSYSSMKYAGRAPAGFALLRVFLGGSLRPDLTGLADSEIYRVAAAEMRDLLGITCRPLFQSLARYPNSMPQYELGHLGRVARIEARAARHRTLQLAGNGYRGVGIPDCVASGERAAEAVFSSLPQDTRAISK